VTLGSTEPDFLVVGVGASAGGLEALERLFAATPADIGMAFVVVQHLSPDFESRMDELLARHTKLPTRLVTDGIAVEPNAIYLIPPRKEMVIANGKLLLTDKDDARGFSLPIDHFLRSLAHDVGPRAAAIILSGAGSDGSRGVREVHEAGGLVLVQTPESARFQGMPLSAKQSGCVDRLLLPEEMAAALVEHARSGLGGLALARADLAERPANPVDEILGLLRTDYGIEFAHYKPSTVLRRIERRLALTHQADLDAYARLCAVDPEELSALYRDLLIGVTRFFRDGEAFDELDRTTIPQLLARVPPDEEIRVWVAGCATGEEAYSLAILFHEHLAAARRPLNLRIFATDVHRHSLDLASAGLYDDDALSGLTAARRQRYFTRDGHRWRVSKELRQLIVFARHDVITDAPFTRIDLLSCRNLLIYLQPPVQKKVLALFHFALKSGGFLLLGPSETPGELSDELEVIDGHWRLYAKRRDARLAEARLPLVTPARAAERPTMVAGRPWPGPQLLQVYDRLLDRVMPPSLLIDENYQLVHAFGGAEHMLHLRGGRPSTNVLDLVEANLKVALVGALQHAHKERRSVRLAGVPTRARDGAAEDVTLTVEPIGDGRTATTHYLVRIERAEPQPERAAPPASVEPAGQAQDYVTALESELRFTKESLQATIEELETANEELQATNEELVASNEELQSTNEELHSVNEELYTVNVEHQRKITQLTELTDDLDNLLHSIDVGVLFLDEHLCIRKFTAQMARLFRLLPQDVGRRFDSFAHTIQHPTLEGDVQRVLDAGQPIEREVTSRDGVIYFMRVLPYRGASNKRGVVVTLIDVSALRRSEAHVRRLSSIVETSADAILAKDLDGTITAWNGGAERMYGWTAREVLGRHVSIIVPPGGEDEVKRVMERVRRGVSIEPYETTRVRKDGSRVDVWLTVSPLLDEHDEVIGAATIARDITQRKRDAEEVRRSLRMRDQFMAMLSHELRNPLAALMHACALLHQPGIPDERRMRALQVVERQCRHMARLLDDVLDVSRLRQDGIELRRRRVDLRATLDAAVERMRPLAEQTGVELTVEVPGHEIAVVGDPDRLQQVEANLISNAIKYTPGGRRVRLSLGVEGGAALIRVEDEGIGIPADMLDRIFEPFVRAVPDDEPVHGQPSGGMGLGLALVRSIVRAHGGEVRAMSDGPQRGSVLEVRLPLAPDEAVASGEGAPPTQTGINTLLLVEDQQDGRELLTSILEHAGYEVYAAADGKRAVELAAKLRPAVALVDIGLPELSGYEVARRVRAGAGGDGIFLVALTGYGQQHDRENVIRAGFDQHLVKPVETALLLEILRTRPRLRLPAADLAAIRDAHG
jgi:two-component system CheB/CheR fusion protein